MLAGATGGKFFLPQAADGPARVAIAVGGSETGLIQLIQNPAGDCFPIEDLPREPIPRGVVLASLGAANATVASVFQSGTWVQIFLGGSFPNQSRFLSAELTGGGHPSDSNSQERRKVFPSPDILGAAAAVTSAQLYFAPSRQMVLVISETAIAHPDFPMLVALLDGSKKAVHSNFLESCASLVASPAAWVVAPTKAAAIFADVNSEFYFTDTSSPASPLFRKIISSAPIQPSWHLGSGLPIVAFNPANASEWIAIGSKNTSNPTTWLWLGRGYMAEPAISLTNGSGLTPVMPLQAAAGFSASGEPLLVYLCSEPRLQICILVSNGSVALTWTNSSFTCMLAFFLDCPQANSFAVTVEHRFYSIGNGSVVVAPLKAQGALTLLIAQGALVVPVEPMALSNDKMIVALWSLGGGRFAQVLRSVSNQTESLYVCNSFANCSEPALLCATCGFLENRYRFCSYEGTTVMIYDSIGTHVLAFTPGGSQLRATLLPTAAFVGCRGFSPYPPSSPPSRPSIPSLN